jgi:predicted phosphoribosyltransferase
MPSFDIVSEVDNQEIDNAINQARKELATRFDLKDAQTEIISEKDKLVLTADDAAHLRSSSEDCPGAGLICAISTRKNPPCHRLVMPGRN